MLLDTVVAVLLHRLAQASALGAIRIVDDSVEAVDALSVLKLE